MDTGTGGSGERKAYTIRVKINCKLRTLYMEKVYYSGMAS